MKIKISDVKVLFIVGLIASGVCSQQPPDRSPSAGDLEPVQTPEVRPALPKVWLSGERVKLVDYDPARQLYAFPDGGVFLARRRPTYRLIVPVCNRTVLFEGSDIRSLRSAKTVLTHGEPGSVDNGYAGVHSGYVHDGLGEPAPLIAFYHAEDQENMPAFDNGVPGYYGRVCGAVSCDRGETWRKLGPLLQSFMPKEFHFYNPHADRGLGMCGAVKDKTGRYVYLYYTENSRVDRYQQPRGIVICMARAELREIEEWKMIVPKPDLFKKYYDGDFTQPGVSGFDTPVITTANVNALGLAEAGVPQPSYSPEFDVYVMVYHIGWWTDRTSDKSGIYLSFSVDGIRWGTPVQLIKRPLSGPLFVGYATIIWDESLGATGVKTGWLLYSYHPDNVDRRYLAGQRIALSHQPPVGPAARDFVRPQAFEPAVADPRPPRSERK